MDAERALELYVGGAGEGVRGEGSRRKTRGEGGTWAGLLRCGRRPKPEAHGLREAGRGGIAARLAGLPGTRGGPIEAKNLGGEP